MRTAHEGRIIGSCGHDISDLCGAEGDWGHIVLARKNKEGHRVASYEAVCRECRDFYFKHNCVLFDETEIDDWMNGSLRRTVA